MDQTTHLSCRCGRTRLEVTGQPFMVTECLCNSCRAAAARLGALSGAPPMLTPYGATPCAEVRKDRLRIVAGADSLREFRLTPTSGTRRVVAACCNTPLFIEARGGHWVSLYLHLWPPGTAPAPRLRTMTGDLADPSALPADIPNRKTHSLGFLATLLAAWVGMGFRNPKIAVAGQIDA
jgi:hypothetical protein